VVRVLDIIIGLGWVVFWIYWLIAAFSTRSGTRIRSPRSIAIRVAFGVVLVIAHFSGLFRVGHSTYAPVVAAGFAVFALGLALAVWARIILGASWGMPMSIHEDTVVVTSGPYQWIRHPIYTGILLAMVGTGLALAPALLVVVVLVGSFFIYSATVEERNMASAVPAYDDYRRKTWMLIPFVF
jgi:protein-S-isoprenylcysteine O-methyltransferase Ste14